MATHKITKGLDLPLSGRPIQVIREKVQATRVGVVADDFPGMKPSMHVEEGQSVKRGQILFEDRKSKGVLHTSPGAGRVIGIHRGAKRALQSVVIDLSDAERAGELPEDEYQPFPSYTGKAEADLTRSDIRDLLVESGQWVALRTRPYSKVPSVDSRPAAIFVTAIDSAPLAPLPEVVLAERGQDFERGLRLLARLTEGKTYLCLREHSDLAQGLNAPVEIEYFSGPHPAGNPGLHIHLLEPVHRNKTVWHIGYQDVASIGHLFRTGQLDVERIVSLAGPPITDPRLVRTRLGICIDDVIDQPFEAEVRLISGSVLSGKKANSDSFAYLGRYERQISVLAEGREREFMGWLAPGRTRFSVLRIFLSNFLAPRKFEMNTSLNGAERAMVPIGSYERVMPMDILPTFLLRSMLVGDVERAEELGVLELDEEDLALCTFVCHSKIDYGPVLRRNLEIIEKEG
ncbi:MAG: Na(+)-translocating NADH-quinone reductase subunit A [Myxococcota bacterium]|nr:Na(+)-translocating NADH-quinone reductase subunit A [Myxococcota bacterium]